MNKHTIKDGQVVVTLLINKDSDAELDDNFFAEPLDGPAEIKKVYLTSQINQQAIPLNESFECVVEEQGELGWLAVDFFRNGLLSHYEGLEGTCVHMSYKKEPDCSVSLMCPEAGRSIDAFISDKVLSEVGLLGIPKGYPVTVDIQRRNGKFEVIKLISPTARDVFDVTKEPFRHVRAFSHWYWSKNRQAEVIFGVSVSEEQPVLRINIKGKFLLNAGLKKITRRPNETKNIDFDSLVREWEYTLRNKPSENDADLEIWLLDVEIEWFGDQNKWAYHRLISPRQNRFPRSENEISDWIAGEITIVLNDKNEGKEKGEGKGDKDSKFKIKFEYHDDDIGMGETWTSLCSNKTGGITPVAGMKAIGRMKGNEQNGLVYWNLMQFHRLTLPDGFNVDNCECNKKELVS